MSSEYTTFKRIADKIQDDPDREIPSILDKLTEVGKQQDWNEWILETNEQNVLLQIGHLVLDSLVKIRDPDVCDKLIKLEASIMDKSNEFKKNENSVTKLLAKLSFWIAREVGFLTWTDGQLFPTEETIARYYKAHILDRSLDPVYLTAYVRSIILRSRQLDKTSAKLLLKSVQKTISKNSGFLQSLLLVEIALLEDDLIVVQKVDEALLPLNAHIIHCLFRAIAYFRLSKRFYQPELRSVYHSLSKVLLSSIDIDSVKENWDLEIRPEEWLEEVLSFVKEIEDSK